MAKSQTSTGTLTSELETVKSTIQCLSVVQIMFSGLLLGLTFYVLVGDSGFQDWIDFLKIGEFNIGLYILMPLSVLMIVAALLGGFVAYQENPLGLLVSVGVQGVCFLLALIGSVVLLVFSSHNSAIQPMIHDSMTDMITNSFRDETSQVLRLLQENIGCCGAEGALDYTRLNKPVPPECRDTVTGNAFFYGCVDQLTWYLEDRTYWVVVLTLLLCFLHIVQAVLSLVLSQGIKKIDEGSAPEFRR